MAAAKKDKKKLTLKEALKEIEKDFGAGAVIKGNQVEPVDDVVSTGSLGLDLATGIGGIPISKGGHNGKIIEMIGWESSSKSTLAQTIMGNAQKKGLTCLLLDGENSLDATYSPKLGLNLEELLLIQLDEKAGEGAYDKMNILVETGEIDLVVIDSYNALQPKKIVDGETGEASMGLHARMLGAVVMKCNNHCKAYGTTFIFIGQLREKIGVMFGSPETTQGGNALKFYSHMRITMSRSLTTDNSTIVDGEKVGNLHSAKINKNKMASPFKKANFHVIYGQGIDKYSELLDLAHEAGIGKKYGKTYSYDGLKYDFEEFKELLKDNEDLFNEIREKVIAESKLKSLVPSISNPDAKEELINEVTQELILNEN